MSVTAVPIPPTRRGVLGLLWFGIAAAVAVATWLAFIGAAPIVALKGSSEQFMAYNRTLPGVAETPSGTQYQVLKKGDDDKTPAETDVVRAMLVARLRDGSVVEASQQPVILPLGRGTPKGLAEGLRMMSKGARYRFWMTSDQVFGPQSPDPTKIPPGSVLVIDAEMIGFISEPDFQRFQMQQQMQQMQQMPQGAPGAAPTGH